VLEGAPFSFSATFENLPPVELKNHTGFKATKKDFVVEDSEVQTGRRSEGVFYAGISFIRKLAQASGVFVASVVLTVAGIQEGARPDEVSADALQSLGWGYATTLFSVWMLMMLCVSFYKISRESHEANLAKLAAREG
jgi:Na+/melibiose symporter-like transporter